MPEAMMENMTIKSIFLLVSRITHRATHSNTKQTNLKIKYLLIVLILYLAYKYTNVFWTDEKYNSDILNKNVFHILLMSAERLIDVSKMAVKLTKCNLMA